MQSITSPSLSAAGTRGPSTINDLRSACFAQAEKPYLLLERSLEIVDLNRSGEELLEDNVMVRDCLGRLAVPGDRGSVQLRRNVEAAASRGSAQTLFQLTPGTWLDVGLSRIEMDGVLRILAIPRLLCVDAQPNLQAACRLFGLTLAESKVVEGLAQAQRPKEIAIRMQLSVHTIRAHLRSIYAKLGVNSAIEAQKLIALLNE